ncbi:MAG: hypothetical protein HOB32_11955 [Nitrospina sp.]|jgi:hypothetical protein|nr:hypothetical protein [Nitrospina sp.]
MKIIKVKCQQETDCSVAVGVWNYWDHEHVTEVHNGFTNFQILHEQFDTVVVLGTAKFPLFGFLTYSVVQTMVRVDENTLKGFNIMFGISVRATIKITEIQPDHSLYEMTYEFMVDGWRKMFFPILEIFLKKAMPWWNKRQWVEDLELKKRRQKVLRLGFKDFQGLPKKISNRYYDGLLECKLPIRRLPGSAVDKLSKPLG